MSQSIIDQIDLTKAEFADSNAIPVISEGEKVELLAHMMVELDGLLKEPDAFWQIRDNQVGYFYQAWGGLCTEAEIDAAIEAHLNK